MTLQQLHYFIVTAEMRSFTKAAEDCFVSQPALSHSIRELENELNTRLFLRVGHSIRLTDAGEKCLVKAKEIERSVHEMRRIASNQDGSHEVSIGYVVLGHLNAYLAYQSSCVPREFLKSHQIVTAYDEITEICEHLIERKYDFILIPAGNNRGLPPHEKVQITPDALSLIVSRQNPLFFREEADVSELAGMPFIFYPNNDHLNAAYRRLCVRNGFEPNVVGYGKKMGDIISEVIQKNAVAFCSATFDYLESAETHILRLKGDLTGFHLDLIRLKTNTNFAAANLFEFLKKRQIL